MTVPSPRRAGPLACSLPEDETVLTVVLGVVVSVELTAAGRRRFWRHRAWACTHPVLWSWFAGQLAFTLLVTFVTVLAVTSLYQTRVWWQQHQERRTVRPGTDIEGRR
jgi:hypothetical protein